MSILLAISVVGLFQKVIEKKKKLKKIVGVFSSTVYFVTNSWRFKGQFTSQEENISKYFTFNEKYEVYIFTFFLFIFFIILFGKD